ncbi:hypothetical protein [Knoellia sp. LjRoot47]|uniref:hypothetical protein n=1 Tax=Knoellia sp. LjRoot47 TaxID=3342330 RepID=UPI003ECDC1BD
MGRIIVPSPAFEEVRVAGLEPGVDWISDGSGLVWHRVLRLDADSAEATITVGDTDASAVTLPCDPGGWVLRLAPEARPRR